MHGYEALRTRAAYFPLDRGLVRVTGEDRVRLVHAMCTNNIEQLAPGQGGYAFFLNAQGRVLADANIFKLEDSLLIDTEGSTRAKLYEHIDKYIIADDVTLEDLSDGMLTMAEEGPRTADLFAKIGLESGPFAIGRFGDGYVARVSRTGMPGIRFYFPSWALGFDDIEDAGEQAVETVRLENGCPIYGIDFGEAQIAHETGQMHALNFNKGCYLGQEIVERVRSRGHVNRTLAKLTIEAQEAPQRGTKVLAGEKEAGEVTSAAWSPALGKVVALGMVRTEALAGGLTVSGAPASAAPAGSPAPTTVC
jgi:tRNA-modifying protein YgfZ